MTEIKKKNDLAQRTMINGLGAFLVALFIFLAGVPSLRWIFPLAISIIAVVAFWEYCALLKKKACLPASLLGAVAIFLYIWACFLQATTNSFWPLFWQYSPLIVLAAALFGCFAYFSTLDLSPITNISTTFFGIVYIGVPTGFFVQIMFFFSEVPASYSSYFLGCFWMIFLLAVTKSADIGGYFFGRALGKRKLAPNLSPNKTVAGAVGGIITSVVVSFLLWLWGRELVFAFSLVQALILGIVLAVFGQAGDLAESLLKRDADVKDSSTLPGVGGILDMLDSLLFTAPVLYIFLILVYSGS